MQPSLRISNQSNDFSPDSFGSWAYKCDGLARTPAYAGAVSYMLHAGTVKETDELNHKEAYKIGITPTNYSLTHGGIYVGLVQGPVGDPQDNKKTMDASEI